MARYKKNKDPLSSKKQDHQGQDNWNNLNRIKGLFSKQQKGASERHIALRTKFALLMTILNPVKGIINEFYTHSKARKSGGFSIALGHALRFAIQGEYPNYQVDLSQLLISHRSLPNLLKPKWEVSDLLELSVSWEFNTQSKLVYKDDTALLLIYNITQKHYAFIDRVYRGELEIRYHYPIQYAGSIIAGWLFTRDRTSKQTSSSYYLGELALPSEK